MRADAEYVLLSGADGLSRGDDEGLVTLDHVPRDADGGAVTENAEERLCRALAEAELDAALENDGFADAEPLCDA